MIMVLSSSIEKLPLFWFKSFTIVLVGSLLSVLVSSSTEASDAIENMASGNPLPNVVVIIADDLGYSDISHNPYSGPEVSTPHIDSLIENGVFFSNAYATANICATSRSGFLIGAHQHRAFIHEEFDVNQRGGIPTSIPIIAEQLKQADDQVEDYVSIMVGKWHNGRDQHVVVTVDGNNDGDFKDFGTNDDPTDDYGFLQNPESASAHPMNRGFDEVFGFLNLGGQSYWDYEEGFYENFFRHNSQTPIDGIDDGEAVETYLTTRLTDKACEFIERQSMAEKPFYVHLAYSAVHSPLHAPPSPDGLSPGDAGWFPGAAWYRANFPDMWQTPTDLQPGQINTQEERDSVTARRADYLALLHHMDTGIGRVIQTLKDQGVYDNTIVIFWSDNGGIASHAANAPLRRRKQFNYEGGIRVPMSITWPSGLGEFAGTTRPNLVSSIDILPTIMDAAGITPVQGFELDGKSWLPLIRGEVETLHDALYWSEGASGEYAVRKGDWKLYVNKSTFELYNLAEDIGERNNLAASRPDKLRELRQMLFAWMESVTDEAGDDLESRLWSFGETSSPDGSPAFSSAKVGVSDGMFELEFDEKVGWLPDGTIIEVSETLRRGDWVPASPDELKLIDRYLDTATYRAGFSTDRPKMFFRLSDGSALRLEAESATFNGDLITDSSSSNGQDVKLGGFVTWTFDSVSAATTVSIAIRSPNASNRSADLYVNGTFVARITQAQDAWVVHQRTLNLNVGENTVTLAQAPETGRLHVDYLEINP